MFRDLVIVQDAIVVISIIEISMQSSSIFGDILCTLHSIFPDDPMRDYYEKEKIILDKLQLSDLYSGPEIEIKPEMYGNSSSRPTLHQTQLQAKHFSPHSSQSSEGKEDSNSPKSNINKENEKNNTNVTITSNNNNNNNNNNSNNNNIIKEDIINEKKNNIEPKEPAQDTTEMKKKTKKNKTSNTKNKPPKKRARTSKKKNIEDSEEDPSLDDYNKDNWEDELENSSFLISSYELERKMEGERSVQNSQNSILNSLKVNSNNNNNNSNDETSTSDPSNKSSSTNSDDNKKPCITMSQKFSSKLKGFMYSKKSNISLTSDDSKPAPKPAPLVNEVSNLSEKIITSSSNYNVNNNKLYEDTSDRDVNSDEPEDDDEDINDLELDYDFESTESSTMDSIIKKKRKFIWD
ncbi:hypothetical protein PIROE2DRAFT_13135 [Piromyces sp. E2]|nr:hypothetical protein PIROE2DRAFT_13135 [Piromyces sp. E2]|eukprot:OUM60975.1 hypothetical protein PIROE2DRAFT_13135 [Piromyces sp. E2]